MMVNEALLNSRLVEYSEKFDKVCVDKFSEMFQRESVSLAEVESIDGAIEALGELYNQIYFMAMKAMFLRDFVESKLVQMADENGFIPTSETWKPSSVNAG